MTNAAPDVIEVRTRLVGRIKGLLGKHVCDQPIGKIGMVGFDADGNVVYSQSAPCHFQNFQKIVPFTLINTVKNAGAVEFVFLRSDPHGDSRFTDADIYILECLIELGVQYGVTLLDQFIVVGQDFMSAQAKTTCFN